MPASADDDGRSRSIDKRISTLLNTLSVLGAHLYGVCSEVIKKKVIICSKMEAIDKRISMLLNTLSFVRGTPLRCV